MSIRASQICGHLCVCSANIKETSKVRITGSLWREPPMIGGFPTQRASNAESVFLSWRHNNVYTSCTITFLIQAGLNKIMLQTTLSSAFSPKVYFYSKCTAVCYRNWYQYWGYCCLINDLGSSPQPEGEARGLWWASQVLNETTLTEIEVSISIL